MSQLINLWQGLNKREQLMLGIGSLLALLIVMYSFIYSPWQARLTQLRDQVPQKRSDLHWMQTQAEQVKPLLGNVEKTNNETTLLTTLENTAQEIAIRASIKRMQPGEDGEVKVWLSDAQFDLWLAWVDVLRQQGVQVSTVNINRSQQDTVSIRATYTRS